MESPTRTVSSPLYRRLTSPTFWVLFVFCVVILSRMDRSGESRQAVRTKTIPTGHGDEIAVSGDANTDEQVSSHDESNLPMLVSNHTMSSRSTIPHPFEKNSNHISKREKDGNTNTATHEKAVKAVNHVQSHLNETTNQTLKSSNQTSPNLNSANLTTPNQTHSTNTTTPNKTSAMNIRTPLGKIVTETPRKEPAPVEKTTTKKVFYSHARNDRSGQVIFDMLKAHAACYNNGWIYGGACGKSKHSDDVNRLIMGMHLDDVIGYNCPKNPMKTDFIPVSAYLHNEIDNFSPEWLSYMSEHAPMVNTNNLTTNKEINIAVHIRRGDVTLCTDNARRRYFTNSHYLRLLDDLVANLTGPYKVTIYSESEITKLKRYKQYENFDEFVERNYTLSLDDKLEDVWRAFVEADILVMAKSSFSLVPAILRYNRSGVIFPPHKFATPLPHWHVLDDDFLDMSYMEMELLQEERCPGGIPDPRLLRWLRGSN